MQPADEPDTRPGFCALLCSSHLPDAMMAAVAIYRYFGVTRPSDVPKLMLVYLDPQVKFYVHIQYISGQGRAVD